MRIDFVAYAGDCRVWGEFDLDGDRLSDALNAFGRWAAKDHTWALE